MLVLNTYKNSNWICGEQHKLEIWKRIGFLGRYDLVNRVCDPICREYIDNLMTKKNYFTEIVPEAYFMDEKKYNLIR